MRILFLGASDIGHACCKMLLEGGHSVVGILSIPREFRISWSPGPVVNVRFRGFEDLSSAHNIPLTYIHTRMTDPEIVETVRQLKPDIIIVIGWYYLIPSDIRNLAPLGTVGIHGSLLPRFRGGAPLVWTIIYGESRSGVTLYYLEDGVDTGDIIAQSDFTIALEDDISDVITKVQASAIELLRQNVPLLAEGRAPRRKQGPSDMKPMPSRKPEDGRIDWTIQTARDSYNWVRAQTKPYAGAFTYFSDEKLIIWKSRICAAMALNDVPGSITFPLPSSSASWAICCADGQLLEILQVGLPNGESMTGEAFALQRNFSKDMRIVCR